MMTKAIFLEYKFGDYDIKTLYASGANEVVAWMERLTPSRISQLPGTKIGVNLCFGGFSDEICPLAPESKVRLEKLITQAIQLSPQGIIIDHFRFGGHWEKSLADNLHTDCSHCHGKDRGKELARIAKWVRKLIPKKIKTGYYAIPFSTQEIAHLGQDHQLLGQAFDYVSPMLYHRMINRPIEYIHQFTEYLFNLTGKPVVPAIAVKDMPDDLPDQINESILRQEYEQAILPPSAGVCWFSWDGAIEKKKTQILTHLLQ